jgi:hypothetical protein
MQNNKVLQNHFNDVCQYCPTSNMCVYRYSGYYDVCEILQKTYKEYQLRNTIKKITNIKDK